MCEQWIELRNDLVAEFDEHRVGWVDHVQLGSPRLLVTDPSLLAAAGPVHFRPVGTAFVDHPWLRQLMISLHLYLLQLVTGTSGIKHKSQSTQATTTSITIS